MRVGTRLLVALSLVFGLSYPFLWALPLGSETMIAVKAAGVGLLALAAALRARTTDGWLLTAVLALGALGDALLEVAFAAGAAAFAAGHICAILLYLRNRRRAGLAGWTVAALLLLVAAGAPGLLLQGRAEAVPFMLYGLLLGGMAAGAWLSRFPFFVPLGAAMFLASDILIAARIGLGLVQGWPGLAIWLLYYAGQVLIFAGVMSSLAAEPAGRGTKRSLVKG